MWTEMEGLTPEHVGRLKDRYPLGLGNHPMLPARLCFSFRNNPDGLQAPACSWMEAIRFGPDGCSHVFVPALGPATGCR